MFILFFFSSRRRHTRSLCDWSSDVCSSDLGLELHFLLAVLECWNRWFLYQQICSNLNWAIPANFSKISATDLLGLKLHNFLLEVLGCWNKYRWFLYQQIFRKFSTHCPAPSTYCQLICSLFLEGVNDEENG